MFVAEAQWITDQVAAYAPHATTLIDVGSESSAYRTETQPHISEMYGRLKRQGVSAITLDYVSANEPDIVCDITELLEPNKYGPYDVVLASNLLEHVPTHNVSTVIDNLFSLATTNGLVVVTVPFNLPEHGHPIDTMLRPTPQELIRLVGRDALLTNQWTETIRYKEPFKSKPTLSPAPVVTGAVFKKP